MTSDRAIRALHHLTFSTGDSVVSPRLDVPAEILTRIAPLVSAGGGDLPAPKGYAVKITKGDGYAAITFDGPPAFQGAPRAPLATCFLCYKLASAAQLWAHAEKFYCGMAEAAGGVMLGAGNAMPSMPRGPWLAVVLLPGIAYDPAAAKWLGDAARCFAWAVIAEAGL